MVVSIPHTSQMEAPHREHTILLQPSAFTMATLHFGQVRMSALVISSSTTCRALMAQSFLFCSQDLDGWLFALHCRQLSVRHSGCSQRNSLYSSRGGQIAAKSQNEHSSKPGKFASRSSNVSLSKHFSFAEREKPLLQPAMQRISYF